MVFIDLNNEMFVVVVVVYCLRGLKWCLFIEWYENINWLVKFLNKIVMFISWI